MTQEGYGNGVCHEILFIQVVRALASSSDGADKLTTPSAGPWRLQFMRAFVAVWPFLLRLQNSAPLKPRNTKQQL